MPKSSCEAAELYIELADIRPKIWRRIRVPVNATLSQLHDILQCLFDWDDSHLHAFYVGDQEYRDPDQMFDDFGNDRLGDETRAKLSDIFAGGVTKFIYSYDFGDDWRHLVRLDRTVLISDPGDLLVLVGGKNAAPPEDCGGPFGYGHLLGVLSDPDDEEFDDLVDWLGDEFDPSLFDKEGIAARLKSLNRAFGRSWSG